MTEAEINLGKYLAQEAHEYVVMDALAAEKYAEMASELECRERQLRAVTAERDALQKEHEERDVFSERVEKERDDALDRAEAAEAELAAIRAKEQ